MGGLFSTVVAPHVFSMVVVHLFSTVVAPHLLSMVVALLFRRLWLSTCLDGRGSARVFDGVVRAWFDGRVCDLLALMMA